MNVGDKVAILLVLLGVVLALTESVWYFVGCGCAALVIAILASDYALRNRRKENDTHWQRPAPYAPFIQENPPDLPTQPFGTNLHAQLEAYQESLEMDAQSSEKPSEEP